MTDQLPLGLTQPAREIDPAPELPATAQHLLPGFCYTVRGQRVRERRRTLRSQALALAWPPLGDNDPPMRRQEPTRDGRFDEPPPARGTRDWNRALLIWEPFCEDRHYTGCLTRPTEEAALARLADWNPHTQAE